MRQFQKHHKMSFIKKWLKKLFKTAIAIKYAHYVLDLQDWFVFPCNKKQRKIIHLIKEIRQETRIGLNNFEAYQLYVALENISHIPGAIAEIGVFQGGSARLINNIKKDKKMYLFDTFEGLPTVQKIDSDLFHKHQFSQDIRKVKEIFSQEKNVVILKGIFPKDTGYLINNEKFSFVHLDIDLYQGTKDSLHFFYQKMSKGGIIIIHDYNTAKGVEKAVDDFFRDKPETILEPSYSQALVVKL